MTGVISAADETMIGLFSGLTTRQFTKLIRQLRSEGADPALKGRPWGLAFEDRVLLVAVYWRTNMTMRQIAALFGASKSAAGRIIDDLAPKLALRHRKRFALALGSPGETGSAHPARVRRAFPDLHATLPRLTSVPKPGKPGPGRPPGRRNSHKAPIRDPGKKAKRDKTLAQRQNRLSRNQSLKSS